MWNNDKMPPQTPAPTSRVQPRIDPHDPALEMKSIHDELISDFGELLEYADWLTENISIKTHLDEIIFHGINDRLEKFKGKGYIK